MTRYLLTPAAQRDLVQIWEYTADRWGTRQAEKYLRDIESALHWVGEDPHRGHRRDDIREGYRSHIANRHVIFYLTRGNQVEVIRILHQRMDPQRHF